MTQPLPDIVDTRPPSEYDRARPAGAVHLTAHDLIERPYLLPPRERELCVLGEASPELRQALSALETAGRKIRWIRTEDWQRHFPVEEGTPSRTHLWQASQAVQQAVQQHADSLVGRRAIDIACGSGRNAAYLALQGFDVWAVDVLPDALCRAEDLARRAGVTIRSQVVDLESQGALAGWHADLVVVVRYLDRNLFPTLEKLLDPGGILVYETFRPEQAALGHPRNPKYLLGPRELKTAFPNLETLSYREVFYDGAYLAQLIARR